MNSNWEGEPFLRKRRREGDQEAVGDLQWQRDHLRPNNDPTQTQNHQLLQTVLLEPKREFNNDIKPNQGYNNNNELAPMHSYPNPYEEVHPHMIGQQEIEPSHYNLNPTPTKYTKPLIPGENHMNRMRNQSVTDERRMLDDVVMPAKHAEMEREPYNELYYQNMPVEYQRSYIPPYACTKPHGRQMPLQSFRAPTQNYQRSHGITVKGLRRGNGLSNHSLKRMKLKKIAESTARAQEQAQEEHAKLEQYGSFFPSPEDLQMPSVDNIMNRDMRWKQVMPGGPRYFKKTDVLRAIAERKMALQHTYAMIMAEKTREQLHQLQLFNENVCDRQVERTAPSYIS